MSHKIPREQCSPHEIAIVGDGTAVKDRALPVALQLSIKRPLARPPPPTESALTYRVSDAVAISGLSRSTLYELMAEQKLRSVMVAGRRLIPADALRELLLGAA
jgi:excisionase family DNA binding protein